MEDIKIVNWIDNEETGGALVVFEVAKELINEVFSRWLLEVITSAATDVVETKTEIKDDGQVL
jgi:hypothetical protein